MPQKRKSLNDYGLYWPPLGDGVCGDDLAANTFTTTPAEWHIDNSGNQEINYLYYDDGNGPQTPSVTDGLVSTNDQGQPNACTPIVIDMMPTPGDDNNTTLQQWNEKAEAAKAEYTTAKYIYKSIIDGGDTDELMEIVEDAYGNGVWQTRQTLMSQSPYLSESVLKALAQECPTFPYSVALEILLANPSPTMTEKFLWMLENETSFPQSMIDMIATNTGQSTFREELEENLAKSHMRYAQAMTPIISYRWRQADCTNAERLELLEKLDCIPSELEIIDILFAESDLVQAEDRLAAMEVKFGYDLKAKREQSEYMEWMDIVNNNTSLENLPTTALTRMQNLATNYYYTTGGAKARALLNHYYHEDHFIPPYYGAGSAMPRTMTNNSIGTVEVHFLSAYPNPATNYLQLSVDLSNTQLTDEVLTITDYIGRVVETQKVTSTQQWLTIDTSTYASGKYQVTLSNVDKIIKSISFNVAH